MPNNLPVAFFFKQPMMRGAPGAKRAVVAHFLACSGYGRNYQNHIICNRLKLYGGLLRFACHYKIHCKHLCEVFLYGLAPHHAKAKGIGKLSIVRIPFGGQLVVFYFPGVVAVVYLRHNAQAVGGGNDLCTGNRGKAKS